MKRKVLILVSIIMLFIETGCSKNDVKEFEKLLDEKVEKLADTAAVKNMENRFEEFEKSLESEIDKLADKMKEKYFEKREEVLKNYYETTETKEVTEVIGKYMLQDIIEYLKGLKININGDIYKIRPFYISTEYRENELNPLLLSKKDRKFIADLAVKVIVERKDGTATIYNDMGLYPEIIEKNFRFIPASEENLIRSILEVATEIYLVDNYNESWSIYKKLNCLYGEINEEEKNKIIKIGSVKRNMKR